jgi:hypothetical protein
MSAELVAKTTWDQNGARLVEGRGQVGLKANLNRENTNYVRAV